MSTTVTDRSLLTLSFPKKLAPQITDTLRQMTETVSGFTTTEAQGFGHRQQYLTALEKVRGATDRFLLFAIMNTPDVDTVLEQLQQQFARTDMFYWVSPVSREGYF